MKQQNFGNHARIVKGYHMLTFIIILAVLILSIMHLVQVFGEDGWLYTGLIPVLTAIALMLTAYYARVFALKAQDRAIRAEENLRHFLLTGKPLDTSLQMSQIIALRFAADEEFVGLAQKAAKEQLKSTDIKKAIANWKSDHYRA